MPDGGVGAVSEATRYGPGPEGSLTSLAMSGVTPASPGLQPPSLLQVARSGR